MNTECDLQNTVWCTIFFLAHGALINSKVKTMHALKWQQRILYMFPAINKWCHSNRTLYMLEHSELTLKSEQVPASIPFQRIKQIWFEWIIFQFNAWNMELYSYEYAHCATKNTIPDLLLNSQLYGFIVFLLSQQTIC